LFPGEKNPPGWRIDLTRGGSRTEENFLKKFW